MVGFSDPVPRIRKAFFLQPDDYRIQQKRWWRTVDDYAKRYPVIFLWL